MPPDVIRRFPFGTGLVLLRSAPPIVARLRRWTERTDAKQLTQDRAEVEAQLHHRQTPGPAGAPAE